MYHLLDMFIFLSVMWYGPSFDNFLFLQGEMQQLRDKLAVAERTARSEAQLKVHALFCYNSEDRLCPAFCSLCLLA